MECLERAMETLVFDILISLNVMKLTTNMYCDLIVTLMCSVMVEKYKF